MDRQRLAFVIWQQIHFSRVMQNQVFLHDRCRKFRDDSQQQPTMIAPFFQVLHSFGSILNLESSSYRRTNYYALHPSYFMLPFNHIFHYNPPCDLSSLQDKCLCIAVRATAVLLPWSSPTSCFARTWMSSLLWSLSGRSERLALMMAF